MYGRTIFAIVLYLALDQILLQELGHIICLCYRLLQVLAVFGKTAVRLEIVACLEPSGVHYSDIAWAIISIGARANLADSDPRRKGVHLRKQCEWIAGDSGRQQWRRRATCWISGGLKDVGQDEE